MLLTLDLRCFNSLLLNLLLPPFLLHTNHVILLGLSMILAGWMSDVNSVVLYIGWLSISRNCPTLIPNLAHVVTVANSTFPPCSMFLQSFTTFSPTRTPLENHSANTFAITMVHWQ